MKKTAVVFERSCVGVRDPGSYPEFLCGCKRPRGVIRNFYVGVRDPWSYPKFLCGDPKSYPKFLCGCKRPMELSEISMWV